MSASSFRFTPSSCVPFRDAKALARARRVRRKDLTKHRNPGFKIRVLPADEIEHLWISDFFWQVKTAADEGRRCVVITGNPAHSYRKVAHLINKFRVDCKHLWTFNMDEYANERGEVAPESWPLGFMHSFKKFFWSQIDPELRPPERQVMGPTTRNIRHYSRLLEDLGGATACYSGPGWTGHLAFIEPDAPEFDAPLREWLRMEARIVTLSPFTIAQNSLHGFFGMSGDLAAVPPRAATIGPVDVVRAKYRMEMHSLTTAGTNVSWQRMVSRLILHGPVTPRVPSSMLQLLKTDVYVSPEIAADVEPLWDRGY
jgi:6-phosphogluconolactonase/glucosamine-6-phosphate isomerase/deaminase